MKSIKVVFATLIATVGIIFISSFAVNKFNNHAFALKALEYVGAQPATSSTVLIPSNWSLFGTVNPVHLNLSCPGSGKLCMITYDDANTTEADARQLISNYLTSHSNSLSALSDPGTITVGTKSITVYQMF